jgi:transcriptional regulator with XRE-family HTH domain
LTQEPYSDLGAEIKRHRLALKISLTELGQRVGMMGQCSGVVSRWERGLQPPGAEKLGRLEGLFGLAPGTLVRLKERAWLVQRIGKEALSAAMGDVRGQEAATEARPSDEEIARLLAQMPQDRFDGVIETAMRLRRERKERRRT